MEVDSSFSIEKSVNILYADVDKLSFPLVIRKWERGDVFYPFGMSGKKKVSDYFSDNKFSLIDKENTWLLCAQHGEIVWIVGHRTDKRFKVSDETKFVYKITLKI